MQPLAVLDVDGVVADVRHRLHYLVGDPSHDQWADFFAAAGTDPLLPEGAHAVADLARDHDVVWMTGRPERTRDLTEHWLRRHGLPSEVVLMQPDGDERPARLVKLEHLQALATHRPIDVVLDDDEQVVELLWREGFPVRLATWLPRRPVKST